MTKRNYCAKASSRRLLFVYYLLSIEYYREIIRRYSKVFPWSACTTLTAALLIHLFQPAGRSLFHNKSAYRNLAISVGKKTWSQ